MQYLCVPFTFQRISVYLIHIVPPPFKRRDWKFCCWSFAKTGYTYFYIFFLNGPCTWSHMPGSFKDEFTWHELYVLWGRATVTFHPVQTDIHASAHVRTHTYMRTHTLTHTGLLRRLNYMTWASCALGQSNCHISPCTDWHSCRCTCANTHIHAHTHTHTHWAAMKINLHDMSFLCSGAGQL